jgi:hypothetical protein
MFSGKALVILIVFIIGLSVTNSQDPDVPIVCNLNEKNLTALAI